MIQIFCSSAFKFSSGCPYKSLWQNKHLKTRIANAVLFVFNSKTVLVVLCEVAKFGICKTCIVKVEIQAQMNGKRNTEEESKQRSESRKALEGDKACFKPLLNLVVTSGNVKGRVRS